MSFHFRLFQFATATAGCIGFVFLGGAVLSVPPPETLAQLRRLNPHLSADDPRQLPMRIHALLKDENSFFRGSAELFDQWCRLSCADWLRNGDVNVWLHGDIHLGNVGTYPALHGGVVEPHFGLVDFDEAIEGPFQIDLLRAMTALRFAAADAGKHLHKRAWHDAARGLCKHYCDTLTGRLTDADFIARYNKVETMFDGIRNEAPDAFLRKYCGTRRPPQFQRVCGNKAGASHVLEPVSQPERGEIIQGIWRYIQALDEKQRKRIRPKTREQFASSVSDVARWTRIGSGGSSQGVRKYLVIIDEFLDETEIPTLLALKEEPVPSAIRSRMITVTRDGPRAKQVVTAIRQLSDRVWFLAGHTEIGGRSYLIAPKTALDESRSFDLPDRASVLEAAELLGDVLGRAHGHCVKMMKDGAARQAAILHEAENLGSRLVEASAAAEKSLRRAYQSLRDDPVAVDMAQQADAWIAQITAESGERAPKHESEKKKRNR